MLGTEYRCKKCGNEREFIIEIECLLTGIGFKLVDGAAVEFAPGFWRYTYKKAECSACGSNEIAELTPDGKQEMVEVDSSVSVTVTKKDNFTGRLVDKKKD